MIPFRSRSDSWMFTPEQRAIGIETNFSRCPYVFFATSSATAPRPVSFCRTLPYAGTALEQRLRAEGRLQERNLEADYEFLDQRLDVFYDWLLGTFATRNSTASGSTNLLRLVLFEGRARVDSASWARQAVMLF
jgi:hypothetical protein